MTYTEEYHLAGKKNSREKDTAKAKNFIPLISWDRKLQSDFAVTYGSMKIFWPVYTDFNYEEWNTAVKLEYAEQAGKLPCKILYVNSVCLDKEEEEIARGGAALFENGCIVKEIPSGEENVLIVEV